MNDLINSPVDVTSYYFTNKTKKCFPRRIEINGQILALFETGLRCLVTSGKKTFEIFNMSDGIKQYNLRHETDSQSWTLCSTRFL